MDEIFFDENIETVFKIEPPVTSIPGAYGYLGVLLRDKIKDKLQCHVCGKWFKSIASHVVVHNLTIRDYRIKFGFALTTPMMCRSTLSKYSAHGQKMKANLEKRDIKKLNKLNKKNKYRHCRMNRKSLSYQNEKGLCPEQIIKRYLVVCDIVGKEASSPDLLKHDPKLWAAIRRRYDDSINKFKSKNGFQIEQIKNTYTDSKLISLLLKFHKKTGILPRASHFKFKKPSDMTIRNHFGSWNNALALAGLI